MTGVAEKDSLHRMNPATLAFVGDSVYELLVRREIVRRYTSLPAVKLHNFTVKMVRATAQAAAYRTIEPLLSEEEANIFRRGRNASNVTPPKHTQAADYRTATGLEALFGWLFLNGENERIAILFDAILQNEEIEA
jgi:ribonuclease-3 family protein